MASAPDLPTVGQVASMPAVSDACHTEGVREGRPVITVVEVSTPDGGERWQEALDILYAAAIEASRANLHAPDAPRVGCLPNGEHCSQED